MEMKTFRAGIIGFGKQGQIRAKEMPACGFQLRAVADPNINMVRCSNLYNDSVNFYHDHKDIIDELDSVFVSVPHVKTAPITIEYLKKGLPVFAEKPPGISLDDTKKIKKAMKKDSVLMFGFNHRHYQNIQKIVELLQWDELGKLLWIRGVYGKDGMENWRPDPKESSRGILLGQGIHLLDLLIYLLKVKSKADGHLALDKFTQAKSFVSYHTYKPPIDDNTFAILKSQRGVTASFHSSSLLWKRTFTIEMGFENGYISTNGLSTTSRTFGYPEQVRFALKDNVTFTGNPNESIFYSGEDVSWRCEMKEFYHIIKQHNAGKNIQPKNGSIDDALMVMTLLEKIYDN
jgi:predicted dehydrogenase